MAGAAGPVATGEAAQRHGETRFGALENLRRLGVKRQRLGGVEFTGVNSNGDVGVGARGPLTVINEHTKPRSRVHRHGVNAIHHWQRPKRRLQGLEKRRCSDTVDRNSLGNTQTRRSGASSRAVTHKLHVLRRKLAIWPTDGRLGDGHSSAAVWV